MKSKWELTDAFLRRLSEEHPLSVSGVNVSRWGGDEPSDLPYGGPVFNLQAGTYNRCVPFRSDFQSFPPSMLEAGNGMDYLQVVKQSLPHLNELQAAVGRLAFYDRQGCFSYLFPSLSSNICC
jgi:hypothetical protein